MTVEQSLLNILRIQIICEYLSNLGRFMRGKHQYMEQKLEQLILREKDIGDWNGALVYLTRSPPVSTALEAQCTLVNSLRQSENVKEDKG